MLTVLRVGKRGGRKGSVVNDGGIVIARSRG